MCFYTCGLPFSLAASPAFRAMVAAIGRHGSGYRPPAPTTLAGTLLTKAKRKLEDDLKPLHDSYGKYGYTVCSDGWSDARNRCAARCRRRGRAVGTGWEVDIAALLPRLV